MITLDKSATNLLLQALQSQATIWRISRQRLIDEVDALGVSTPNHTHAIELLTEQLNAADQLALQMVAANVIALFPVPEVSTLKRAVMEPLPALCPTCGGVVEPLTDAVVDAFLLDDEERVERIRQLFVAKLAELKKPH